MTESKIWIGRPSQWINAFTYFMCAIVCIPLLIVALSLDHSDASILMFALAAMTTIRAVWVYLDIRCTSYTLTDQRFKQSYGVLSRRFLEVELYRIKDAVVDQPFLLRLFGLSDITVIGFDVVEPIVRIRAVRDGVKLRESIRQLVEARRDVKSVRVSEVG